MISFCSIVYYINMLLNPIIFYIYMYIILGMIGDAALFFSTLFPLNPVVYGLPSIKLTQLWKTHPCMDYFPTKAPFVVDCQLPCLFTGRYTGKWGIMGRGFLIMGSSGLDGIQRSRHQPEGDGEKDREREKNKMGIQWDTMGIYYIWVESKDRNEMMRKWLGIHWNMKG